jgi:hypothetical protein
MTKGRSTLGMLFAAALGAAALAPARAEDKPEGATEKKEGSVRIIQEADKVVVRKRTVIDFGDVTVEGELTKPEGSYLLNRNRTRFQSLIKLRKDFNPELQKSADNL